MKHFSMLMMLSMVWMLVAFLYFSLFEGLWGRTPGKFLCGIRVLRKDFSRCSVGAAMLRNLLRIADNMFYFLVGAVSIGATLKWQRVGDLAASTVVVRNRTLRASPVPSARASGPERPGAPRL